MWEKRRVERTGECERTSSSTDVMEMGNVRVAITSLPLGLDVKEKW